MKRLIKSVVLGGAAAATSLSAGIAFADVGAETVTVPDPFGVSFTDPDFGYTAGNALQSIAYASDHSIAFNSGNLAAPVQQFFEKYVTVDGQPLSTSNGFDLSLQGDIINKLQDGLGSQQQILFGHIVDPNITTIADTNIQSGVIGIHDFGNGYGYAYIDLVGPGTTSLNSDVNNAIGAFFVTPYGTFDVSHVENGGDYGGLAYLESQLFDFDKPLDNPFGIALTGDPDFGYQTAGVFGNTAYGSQGIDFHAGDVSDFAKDFFQDHGVNLGALSTALNADGVEANIIDSLNYTGIDNGLATQQLFLPAIDGTNIENAAITLQNLGDGFSYDSIGLDLAGTGATHATTDAIGAWLVTPFGDYDVSPWASLAAQVFDPNYFDIGGFPADNLIPPTFDFLF